MAIVSKGGSTDSEGIVLENSLTEAQFNTSVLTVINFSTFQCFQTADGH